MLDFSFAEIAIVLVIALVVLLLFLWFGKYALEAMHLRQESVSIAGGIVLFLIGIRMIFPPAEGVMGELPDGEPFIVPVAIFVITGAWAVPLLHSGMPFDDIRRVAAILQRTELAQIDVLNSVWLKARTRIWNLGDFCARPAGALQSVLRDLGGDPESAANLPAMRELAGAMGVTHSRVAQTPLVSRMQSFGTTIFAEMSALAVEHDAVNLGQGFPDTDGPASMLDAAREAISDGRNQYPPGIGVPELRHAVARQQRDRYGLDYDPDREVLITVGATEAIAGAVVGLVEPGDEVIMIEPYYDVYAATVAMAGSSEPALAAADAVAPDNAEDGVLAVLEHWFADQAAPAHP